MSIYDPKSDGRKTMAGMPCLLSIDLKPRKDGLYLTAFFRSMRISKSGYADWVDRPGRFRSLGDGQIDFKSIFSKLTQYGFDGWAVLEWECCIKSNEQGAKEGSKFILDHIIEVTEKTFDDFADSGSDEKGIKKILGLD